MMNIEKYYKELVELKEGFAVNKETGKAFNCYKGTCNDCKFSGANNDYGYGYCNKATKFKWLFEEYKEPLLTEDEKEFLKVFIKLFDCEKPTIIKLNSYIFPKMNNLRIVFDGFTCNTPYFDEDKLFKGLKPLKQYTLKDLDIDE